MPAAYPRLAASTSRQSARAASSSAVPSVEPLSTTTTSAETPPSAAGRESSNSPTTCALLYVTTTTLNSGHIPATVYQRSFRRAGLPESGSCAPDGRYGERMRLLLIAPTCDGEDVGEAWVAYQWARLLAERHEVTLLTYHKRGRTPAARQLSGLRVVEWAEPPGLGRAERLNSMPKPAYVPFCARAGRWVRRALAAGERWDLAHQPLPVAMRYPCPVAGLGIPYLVGPVGGSLDSPPGFAADEGSTPWYVGLRALDRVRLP